MLKNPVVEIQVGLKSCSFHRRIEWWNSFCPTRPPLARRTKNVSKISAQLWSPRAKLELSLPRGRNSSPRAHRKTSALVTSRREKKNFDFGHLAHRTARGDQWQSFSVSARWWSPTSVHLFSRHFWLSLPGGAQLGKMSFTIKFVYENYNF